MHPARSAIETLALDGNGATSAQSGAGAGCPLCGGRSRVLDRLPVVELRQLYRRRFGIAIDDATGGLAGFEFRRCEGCGLRFFDPPRPADGEFYEHLAAWFTDKRASPPDKAEFAVGMRHVEEGDAVLDVGCGRGPFAARIPRSTRYVGLELNPAAVGAGGRDIRSESLEEHARRNRAAYDVVCSFQVLEHVVDPRAFLALCKECLKPGGKLIISVPNADGFMGAECDNILNMPPHHLTWWSRRNVEHIADMFDLDVIEIAEEGLAEAHRKAFLKLLAMNFWRARAPAPSQFLIGGTAYRIEDALARLAARLLHPALRGVEFAIRGHSITGVYAKRRAA